MKGMLVNHLPGGNLLSQSLRISHHVTRRILGMPLVKGLRAENLRWGIHLSVLYITLVARRKHKHRLLTENARQVMIYVTGVIKRITYHDCRHLAPRHGPEHHGRRRAGKIIHRYYRSLAAESLSQGLPAARRHKFIT